MLEKFQLNKIAKRSYLLKAFLTKSKSILTQNHNVINILDADIIGAGIINLVFCFSIFPKSVS